MTTMMGRPREAFDGMTRNRRIPAYWVSEGEEARWRAVLAPIIDGKIVSSVQRMNRLLDTRDAAQDMVRLLDMFSGAPEALQEQADVLRELLRTDA